MIEINIQIADDTNMEIFNEKTLFPTNENNTPIEDENTIKMLMTLATDAITKALEEKGFCITSHQK